MVRFFSLCVFLLFPVLLSSAVMAGQEAASPEERPIPRFVSLNNDKVFVRAGPALRYPIKWIFQKKGMPVEIIQEFDTWRKIRDRDGDEGWIHQSLLSGKRYILVQEPAGEQVPLQKSEDVASFVIAKVEPGVVGRLERCGVLRCAVEIGGYSGWMERKYLWGIYDNEKFD